jgi:hypothetical protein
VNSVPGTAPSPPSADAGGPVQLPATSRGWRIEAREHVDLWLHGFALLQGDSSLIPYFKPGYGSELSELRRGRGISTQLDDNTLVLRSRLAQNPNLISAQFVALYFASWTDLRVGTERFLRDGGNVRAAQSNQGLRMYATLATYFPTAADRDWLGLFVRSLDDERTRFHRDWWSGEQQARGAVLARFTSEWNGRYAAAFGRLLAASSQREGAIVLSLPLGGEGRTLNVGQRDNFVTVGFPSSVDASAEILYAIAHEIVGGIAATVVRDHTSAAADRSGEGATWTALAPVRAGLMLLERVAPELADGYRAYYLQLARQSRAADLAAQFTRIFPLPAALVTALEREIQMVLDGI